MRKIIFTLLVFAMIFTLSACGCEHENWNPANCQTPKTCNNCGKIEGTTTAHKWKAATCKSPKTCTECGKTEGSTADHKWSSATCTKAKECSICKAKSGNPLGHSYDAGKCIRCSATDPKYTQLNWKDIFTGSPFMNIYMNSVGGIAFAWGHDYTGGKTVNYITITFTLIDAVGNPIKDELHHKSTHQVRIVGPWSGNRIEYGGLGSNPDILVYCGACHKVRFDSILLEYADGTFGSCTYGWENTFS